MSYKRILYLSYTGLTEPLGQSQVLAYLQGLSALGKYKFTVVSFERAELLSTGKDLVTQACAASEIEWHPLLYVKTNPVIAAVNRVRQIKSLCLQLHQQEKFDLVHCRSYRASLIGLWLKRKKGLGFVFDMRGFWADERVDGGVWNLKHPVYNLLYRYYKRKEKQLLQAADHIISLTENAKREIHQWYLKGQPLPISVIPCCVDLDLFDPSRIPVAEQESFRREIKLPEGGKVVSYLGSLGTWYLLDEMLQFFSVWYEKDSAAVLLFVTNDPAKAIVTKAAAYGIPESALRIISVKRHRVPLALSISDYSLFFIMPSFSKKASSPVKQGEIMAMGIPVICNGGVGDTAEIVNQYKAGYVVRGFEPDDYERSVSAIASQEFDRGQIRAGAKEFFSLERGIQLYDKVYQNILSD